MIYELIKLKKLREQVDAWSALVKAAQSTLDEENAASEAAAFLKEKNWSRDDVDALAKLVAKASEELDMEMEAAKTAPAAAIEEDSDGAFIPSRPALCTLQMLIEMANIDANMMDRPKGQGLAGEDASKQARQLKTEAQASPGQKLFYSIMDEPGVRYFSEGAKAVAWRWANNAWHAFSNSPTIAPLAKKARLVIVGDWGSGVGRAQDVAKLMRQEIDAAPDVERHVIHLGDIYFAGWPRECRDRFLAHWPVKQGGEPGISSWCLNGNHDMYSGGDGYFDVVLGDVRFAQQKQCSYFALRNDDWQFIGLDTAYDDWHLPARQVEWAADRFKERPKARGVLLSHHQPYSSFESQDKAKALAAQAAPLLKGGLTSAWFWGHEHRCAIYKPLTFDFADGSTGALPFGACFGHGGVPTSPKRASPPETLHTLTATETNGFLLTKENFARMGFVVLDIDGASGRLRCVDERGNVHFTHDF